MKAATVAAIALVAGFAASAQSQETVRLTGRLVDRSTGLPVTSGNVRLDDGTPSGVGPGGTFQVQARTGVHVLHVRALGYAPWQRDVALTGGRDTAVVIDLEPRPFMLDTVRAESRTVKAKTTIRDDSSRMLLADVEVTTNWGARKNSGHTGLVSIDVPIGERTYVLFSAFGYLPVVDTLDLARDSSFVVRMKSDPVAARMIQRQIARLAERARTRPTVGKSVLDRREIINGSEGNMYLLLQRHDLLRGACVLLDDVHLNRFVPMRAELEGILPDRVERVELLERGNMLRIYTREYIRRMMTDQVQLGPISYLANGRFCK